MKKQERIEALEIASSHDIKVTNNWWSPFGGVEWKVLRSKRKLSEDQYVYLSRNNCLAPKKEIKKGEIIILNISDLGKAKLIQLKPKTKTDD